MMLNDLWGFVIGVCLIAVVILWWSAIVELRRTRKRRELERHIRRQEKLIHAMHRKPYNPRHMRNRNGR